ncbi:unnamed protein product [Paramecium sonneborni]|uniref:Uncharacterized protein n=1 Tax=Paramecium sonneborni TaxID=65129 RepID=A0A8S1QWZ8_9CILI|nr:unnamed protein product [Paramecium sonneborni]
MNRLISNPTTAIQTKMTSLEYLIHQNIPIPNHAKYPHPDLEANSHISHTLPFSSNNTTFNSIPPSYSSELNHLKKLLEDQNKLITFLKQTENQYNILQIQFQETNHNHSIQINQLYEQLDIYKQANNNMKIQLEEYLNQINSFNFQFQELYSQKEELSSNLKDKSFQYDNLLIKLQNQNKEIIQLQDKNTTQECYQFGQNLLLNEVQNKSQIHTQIINDNNLQIQVKNLENKNSQLQNRCVLFAQEMERIHFTNNQNDIKNLIIENQQLKCNQEQMMLQIQQFKKLQNQIKIKEENSIKDKMRIIILNTEIERLWSVIEDCENRNQQQIQQLEHVTLQFNLLKDEFILFEQQKAQFQQEQMKRLQYEQDILLLQKQQDIWTQSQKELQKQNTILKEEVDRLTFILKEKDNQQNKNYFDIQEVHKELEQKQIEIQKQQNAIIQLEIEISNYQQESMLLNSENDNLNMRISNLEEDMNAKIIQLTHNYESEAQSLQLQVKNLEFNKNQIEQINQILKQDLEKYQIIIDGQQEREKYNLQTNEKEQMIQLKQIQDYQLSLQQNIKENKKMREDLIQERMKIIIFASEIDRLWQVIEDFTNNVKAYEEQKNFQNEKINQLTKLVQQFQNTILKLEAERKQILEKHSLLNIESKVSLLTMELEKVRNSLYEEQLKRQELEIKQKIQLQEIEELYSQIDEFQSEINILQKRGLNQSDLEMKFQAERIQWETQKYQWNNQLQEKEQKIIIQTQEIKRSKAFGEERLQEIEDLRRQLKDQKSLNDYDQLKQEYIQLEQQVMELEQINLKLKGNSLALEKQNQLLDIQLQGKLKEIDDAYNLMNRQRKQSEQVNKETENLRKFVQQLQSQNSNFDDQTQYFKEKIHSLENENENLTSQVQYLQNCLLERDQIVQSKNQELSEKIKEIDLLKIKYEQKINVPNVQQLVFRSSSFTRQLAKQEQENIFIESNTNLKLSCNAIISKPPRYTLSQIHKENNNQYE